MAPLIICIVLIVAAYIAQNQLIKSIYMKTGNYLKTGKILPALAGFGILAIAASIAGEGDSEVMMVGVAVTAIGVLLLAIRNIKGAGVGMGIVLAVLQAVCGVAILAMAIISIALSMVGVQLGGASSSAGTVPQSWEAERQAEEREKAEAYAYHDGYNSLQDAVDAGMADPKHLEK